jgi:hypothetical protein
VIRIVAGKQKLDGQERLESSANAMSASSKPESRGFSMKKLLRGFAILHHPMPDLSNVKPKTSSYNTPKNGSENREVSGVVACCVVQIERSNPHGMEWKF